MSALGSVVVPADRLTRRSLILGAGALALAAACSTGHSDSMPHDTVRTALGPVRGVRRSTGFAFLGIPYAQPPVGDLRFAAPVPPAPWTEVRDCTAYGPTAQLHPVAAVTTIPEPSIAGTDYLSLNVFTPDPSPGAKLPVLVWIHGGGFVGGSPASPWYDGSAFNRDGVVLVSLGYRLGIEGFLHVDGAPDNRAVLDWIAGLTWVRDNIAAFGGDPAKVTVAGQSAGGGAVWALMAAPAARSLFRAGICQSGVVAQPHDRAAAAAGAAVFTKRTGVPATVAALRDLSRDRLHKLQNMVPKPGPGNTNPAVLQLAPVADDELIPESSAQLLVSGNSADIPLLLGFTRHEFTMGSAKVTDATAPAALARMRIDASTEKGYRAAYPSSTAAQLIGQIVSDLAIRGPSYRLAEEHARRDRPTWLYEFDRTSTASGGYHELAAHCLDIPFAFDLLDAKGVTEVEGDNPPQALATRMHAAWVSFVRDGDPGPNWPRYTPSTRQVMIWNDASYVAADPFAAQRPLWTR
ncbi:carboxylesterase/lipase family protein [Nocardia jiangxiensis]|uniref:Carboxylic ester hydrolase n=1 Tax=Nocardia jiangxiensis TaxID=282685 RepID=A0ABW6SB33_9NOCA|nr:carboxylesterase family protein [Nocardia jiangxiensis]